MNEILLKRIEEAAVAIAPFNRMSQKRDYFVKGCEWMLNNLWISVEEALPEFEGNFSDDCLIRTEKGWCDVTPYYRTSEKEYWWNFEKVKVTHWMPIPKMKGGE